MTTQSHTPNSSWKRLHDDATALYQSLDDDFAQFQQAAEAAITTQLDQWDAEAQTSWQHLQHTVQNLVGGTWPKSVPATAPDDANRPSAESGSLDAPESALTVISQN